MNWRIWYLGVLLLCPMVSFAQLERVTQAVTHLDNGNLRAAQQTINQASAYLTTKTWYKTWYYRGKIYTAVYLDKTSKATNPGKALFEAARSFDYSLQLARQLKQIPDDTLNIWEHQSSVAKLAFKQGVYAFQEKNYDKSIRYFKLSNVVNSQQQQIDTLSLYYLALAHTKAKQPEQARTLFLQCIDLGFKPAQCYSQMISNPTATFEQDLKSARRAYPQNNFFLQKEIAYLIGQERYDQALAQLAIRIKEVPDWAEGYYLRGRILELKKKPSEAIQEYQKAVAIDSSCFDCLYQLANVHLSKASVLSADEATTTKKRVDPAYAEHINQATLLLEKALQVEPDHPEIVQTLKSIYSMTGQKQKLAQLEASPNAQ